MLSTAMPARTKLDATRLGRPRVAHLWRSGMAHFGEFRGDLGPVAHGARVSLRSRHATFRTYDLPCTARIRRLDPGRGSDHGTRPGPMLLGNRPDGERALVGKAAVERARIRRAAVIDVQPF